jgi:hypothetical protein
MFSGFGLEATDPQKKVSDPNVYTVELLWLKALGQHLLPVLVSSLAFEDQDPFE